MICKYKDLVVARVLSLKKKKKKTKKNTVLTEKLKLKQCFNMKYCLYEEPKPKKQDYKDRFRSRCLFSLTAASQILEILYLVNFLYKLMMFSALELLLWLIAV